MAKTLQGFDVCEPLSKETIAASVEVRERLYDFNHSRPSEGDYRSAILHDILGAYNGTYIVPPFHCDVGKNIRFGAGGFINTDCIILDNAPVTIGDYVAFGPRVQLIASTHPIELEHRVLPLLTGKSITIGDNVWIGAGSIVLPGVTIGENSVIGAGSLVTKDIPAGVLAMGHPCKVIREIDHGNVPPDDEIFAMYEKLGIGVRPQITE